MKTLPKLPRSDLAQRLLYLDGTPFRLTDYPFFNAIYDGDYQGLLLKCGRQIAKTTTIGNFIITECIGIPHFKTLFISPSQEQTQRFSNTRLGKVVHYSPLVRQYFTSRDFTDRSMLRMFQNGSEVTLSYARDDPDRARGPSADRCCYDEVQDIMYQEVIPVINECMGNSKYGYETYAGTPKTLENTIEYLWGISTQNEWIIPCAGCNKYNFITSAKAIGLHGPICVKCGHDLDPRQGRWYAFNPTSDLAGFHISQPMLPANREDPKRWKRIINKLERYSETKFKNEVLGISDAIGSRLVSKEELESLCSDYDIYRAPRGNAREEYVHVVAGIDWSGGGTQGVSRTVLWIWGVTKDYRLRTLYFRIYPVTSPVQVIDDIVEVLEAYAVELVVGDRGEGYLANTLLGQKIGPQRVYQVKYGSQASPITWNEKAKCYYADRTVLMDNFFMVLKRGGAVYPNITYMTEAIKDTLNIYEEVTREGKKVWRCAPSLSDDAYHAQLFGWLAAKFVMMDLEFTG